MHLYRNLNHRVTKQIQAHIQAHGAEKIQTYMHNHSHYSHFNCCHF